jgi:predicted nuclease of predicted toxin-antitoxin system
MHFLIDANLPRSILPTLARLGHSAEHVNDIGLKGAPDEQIVARARATQAALITRDLDFSDIRQYPPADFHGIVVMRIPDDTAAADIVRILERFMHQTAIIEQLPGHLVILESDHFRFRPALID